MASLNRVTLIGHLGRDPETRYMPEGGAVTNVSIATTETWKDKTSGEKKENTEWHRLVFFNRLGEIAGEYLKKGSQIWVEGRLRTRKWQDKDGVDKYTTEIICDNLLMLGGKPNDGGDRGGQRSGGQQPERPAGSRGTPPAGAKKPAGRFDDMDDDIPF